MKDSKTLRQPGLHSHDDHHSSLTQSFMIRVADFEQRKGNLILNNSDIQAEDPLIHGQAFMKNVRNGLNISYRRGVEEQPFLVDGSRDAGLSCIFSLQGQVGLRIAEQEIPMTPNAYGKISALGVFHPEEEPFQRITRQAQPVQHLIVNASPEWLAASGLEEHLLQQLKPTLARRNMVFRHWPPSDRLTSLIQDTLTPTGLLPELINLQLEARAIDIVTETLMTLIQQGKTNSTDIAWHNQNLNLGNHSANIDDRNIGLNKHEQIRLQRAQELILSDPGQAFSVGFIAQQAGISSSGLQRLFHRIEGCSVFDYVRRIRLEKAYQLLQSDVMSVQEVSTLMGYKNPANFATAFKRRFGITPRQASQQT